MTLPTAKFRRSADLRNEKNPDSFLSCVRSLIFIKKAKYQRKPKESYA